MTLTVDSLPAPSAQTGDASKKTVSSPPKSPPGEKVTEARQIGQGEFEPEQHFYPRVLNAQIHPLIQSFFTLGNDRIIARYTHLNPQVNPADLKEILSYNPKYFQWAGKETKIFSSVRLYRD
jgi:hypothetical protein